MNTEKRKVGTLDLTPSWESAVRIYCAVLQNPKAAHEAKYNAEQDLLKLAQWADKKKAESKTIASLERENFKFNPQDLG